MLRYFCHGFHNYSPSRSCGSVGAVAGILSLMVLLCSCLSFAENQEAGSSLQALQNQTALQERRIAHLEAQVSALLAKAGSCDPSATVTTNGESLSELETDALEMFHGENKGAVLEPLAHEHFSEAPLEAEEAATASPNFSMDFSGRLQFRYNAFIRNGSTTTTDNGIVRAQRNERDFEIERGRLTFSGYVGEPELQYFFNLDADTDENHDVVAHDFWFSYELTPEFEVFAGKAFVPGSREWIGGSTASQFIDRSMATSFFRPDRSLGLWVIGKHPSGLNYRAMVGNGFATTDFRNSQLDQRLTYAGTVWGSVIGDLKGGRSDLDWHEQLAVRVGASGTYSPLRGSFNDRSVSDEAARISFADGQPITAEGAFAAGRSISEADLYLYAVDLAARYKGIAFNSEAYYRTLRNAADADGIIASSLNSSGVSLDLGYMVIPKRFEVVGRYSYVDGERANADEFGTGVNYFVSGSHLNKFSLDASWLRDTAISSSGPNFRAGATGTLIRFMWQVGF